MKRKQRQPRKLTSCLLALMLLVTLALPASARGWGCRGGWWFVQRCCPCRPAPSQPETPAQPDIPTTPDTPAQPDTPEKPAAPEASAGALERQVAELVNRERAANGLPALTLSTRLCDGARLKSQDMAQSRYFDHNSPNYGSPFDMMRSLGITYAAAGENIAMGYATAEAVVAAWMASPGHRANILSENYTHIGVGYVANGNYWTQWFTR